VTHVLEELTVTSGDSRNVEVTLASDRKPYEAIIDLKSADARTLARNYAIEKSGQCGFSADASPFPVDEDNKEMLTLEDLRKRIKEYRVVYRFTQNH